ncbi:DDE-type integrase/transposase/recombinase [Micromonospora coxensis]|uniref:DDE-type integrase/transposase/recombinase n=1 Tax=Micromonospora coxensis TaxID=356852 RepID=UPI003F557D6E
MEPDPPGRTSGRPGPGERAFTAPAVAWCGDMTEIRTDEGQLYLATVIDLYSRRILGYVMGAHRAGRRSVEHGRRHPTRQHRRGDVPQRQRQPSAPRPISPESAPDGRYGSRLGRVGGGEGGRRSR